MRPSTLRPVIARSRRRSRKQVLRIESLEPREVPATLDLSSNVLTYTAGTGIDNTVSVTISGNNFLITESGETIDTTIPGSTGSGTGSVTVPMAGVTGVVLNLADGANAINATGAINLTTQNVTVTSAGSALTLNGAVVTTTGNISLSSANALTVSANVNAGSGTIAIAANTDGTGNESLSQTAGTITTTNASATAAIITVNTSSGGTGNAVIDSTSIGSNSGGRLTVQSNGGNIVYAGGAALTAGQIGLNNGGSAPARVLAARDFNFTATGAGAIGTTTRPMQTSSFGTDAVGGSVYTLVGGDGGVFLTKWAGIDMTLASASATGPGGIRVVAAAAAGSNLFVTGNVTATTGNIYLAADDNFVVGPGVTIGGSGFTGTVWMQANRDLGTAGQPLTMSPTSAIVTTNTTNVPSGTRTPTTQAVYLDISGDAGTPSTITLGSITAGNGARIIVNAIPNGIAAEAGTIAMAGPDNVVDAGTTGTIVLTAGITDTANNPAASAIGTPAVPVNVAGGNVVISSNLGNVNVSSTTDASMTTTVTAQSGQASSAPPTVSLATTSGVLTIPAALANVNGGSINLAGASGVLLNAQVGGAATGAINITGPLSGTGNIVLGSAGVTVSQNANSTYDGVISGSEGFAKTGTGTLTLSANQTFTGFAAVGAGTLNLVGSLTGTNGAAAALGATLANTNGSIAGPVTIQGTIAPGGSGVAIFNTGAVNLSGGGTLAATVNGATTPGTDYDQIAVTGTVNVTNANVRILVGASPTLTVGQTFAILANDGADTITGQFANGATIAAFDNPRYLFTPSYAGGDGNDIVLTLATILPPQHVDVSGGGSVLSYQTGAGFNSSLSVSVTGGNYTITDTAGPITLSAASIAAGWTGDGTTSVTGPAAAVTSLNINLSDGTDTINGLNAGSANVTVRSGGSLTTAGTTTATSNVSFADISALTLGGTINPTGILTSAGVGTLDLAGTVSAGAAANLSAVSITAGASSLVAAPSVNLTATSGMGSASNRIKTQATTLAIAAGAGNVFVSEADGATVNATATGTGKIDIVNLAGNLNLAATTAAGDIVVANASGTLTVTGSTSTTSGDISLSSGDDVVLAADLVSSSGAISIAANTDGAGSQGVSQTAGILGTLNAGPTATTIAVNTAAGGTGNIAIDNALVTGTLVANSHGGSILYAGNTTLDAFQQGTQGNGGSAPARVLKAGSYVFTATGAGSIGTDARPMQSDNLNANDSLILSAGSGGAYWTDWGSTALGLAGASATGAGNVRVVTANAGGHNLNIAGPVTAESGSIYLAADDDFTLTAPVGGSGFSGTVYLAGNRDTGNTLNLRLNAGASITTSNATTNAVFLEGWNTNGTRAGGIILNNIKVGSGGTITATTASVAASQGTIIPFDTSVLLDAGATGRIVLTAAPQASATSSIGSAAIPVKATAGTVIATSNTTATTTGTTSGIFVNTTGAASFTASIGGPGTHAGNISLGTASGVLTVAGATSTLGSGTIALAGAGGVVINAPLGGTNTGNMTINAGTNPATLNSTLTLNSGQTLAVSAANGLVVSSTGTIAGTGAAANATPLTVQSGGVVAPGGPGVGTLNVGATALAAGSTLRMDLNSSSSADVLNAVGSLDVSGAILDVSVNGALNLNDAFTILANDGTDAVTGQFVGGTTISGSNDPRYVFSINYAGGDGNDIVATVSQIIASTVLDVSAVGKVTVASADGLANNLTVTRTDSTYTITDTAGIITLSQAATAAGWTGSGTQTVTGPTSGVTGLQFALNTGTDTLNGIDFGSVPLSISGSGSLTVAGSVTGTGPMSVSGVTDIGGTGSIHGSTLTLSASNGIGTSGQRLATSGTALILSAGAGGMFVGEADGANVTATATGSGNIDVQNVVGTLNVAGLTSTATGNITLSSGDAVTLGADVNAGSGTIAIAANTDGAGSQGYDQKAASIVTTNATLTAVSIAVNTAAGGTGHAVIGQGAIGSNSGGGVTVTSNGGSILWSNDPAYAPFTGSQTGLTSGGTNTQTLRAASYTFATGPAGLVGTDDRPLQLDNFGTNEAPHSSANLTVNTGTGGLFATVWGVGGVDLTTGTIAAQGAANIRIAVANSGGHNLWVAGPVTTGTGTISLYADDELTLTSSGLVGGAGFSGLVDMIANRDVGNGQSLNMQAGSAIVTSNATASAVRLVSLSGGNNASTGLSDLTPQGGVVLTNVTVGDGGMITVDAAGGSAAARQGSIVQRADTLVDAGPNGTLVLLARANDTTATTNPLNAGNIGANGDITNLTLLPIKARAGTIVATTNGTNLGNTGVINVIDTIGGTFTATTAGSGTAFVTLKTDAGVLTVGGPTSTAGGAITLTGAGGVIVNGPLGNGTSGAIGIAGPLSGTGNIALGSGALTVTQDANSTFGGVISGSQSITKAGTGSLTLTAANTYTGGTTVSAGGLFAGNATGSATGTGPVTSADGTTLGGSGGMAGSLTVSGTLAPGTGSGSGHLATGPIAF
jgi:autotransporter-associated beta strand protein